MSPRDGAPALTVAAALVVGATAPLQAEIPYFARKYRVACSQCHVAPPKLNRFGESFIAAGYRDPSLRPAATWPFAVWLSARSDTRPAGATEDDVRAYLNRIEIISGGQVTAPWLSYFVEWRPLSQEGRADGTLRDRSGRFEDLFLTATRGSGELTVGQFRQLAQVDVSRRIGLSEPLLLSASLPGSGGGSGREVGLRAFSPAGRSPSVRLGWHRDLLRQARWSTLVAVPFPGEFSIPLTSEARREAGNEIELNPKGVFLETFVRWGLTSYGAHAFVGSGRHLAGALVTGNHGAVYWTGIAGWARSGGVTRGRWSLEGELFPAALRGLLGAGARAEDQGADAADPAVIPFLSAHFPGSRYTVRLTLEQRFQSGPNATFLELGTVF